MKEYTMTKREKIIDLIQKMNKPDAVALHNKYCYATNCFDDEIFDSDRLDEICYGQGAFWIACRVYYGDFNPNSEYIKFDSYCNFQSIYNYNLFDYIDENEIADYILKNDNDFDNNDIKYILDDIEEDSEND